MKAAWILLMLAAVLAADSAVTTKYKVILSLFGKVGEATITVAERGDEYMMIIEDYATGLAAKISGDERDRFVSRGHIEAGRYISDTFEMYQTSAKRRESNVYVFDHDAKTVTRYQDKNQTKTRRSFNAMKIAFEETTYHKITRATKVLDFYSPYDSLSVALNFPQLLASKDRVEIFPVGLAKKERKMYISRPDKAQMPELLEAFHYPGVTSVLRLESYELDSDSSYGVLLGYNAHGGVDEVVTAETYFFIGYGRIEKLGEVREVVDRIFEQ